MSSISYFLQTDGRQRTSIPRPPSNLERPNQVCSASIEEAIASGTTVIVDRYYYSGCVYSAAKHNPLLDLHWARHPEEGLPRPDVCIFLDLPADEAAKRGGWGEERYEKKELQDRVRQLFADLKASPDGADFVTIDAGSSVDNVEEAIGQAVEEVCRRVDGEQRPLRRCMPWTS